MLMIKVATRNVFRQKRRTILTVTTMVGGFVLASLSIGLSDGSYGTVIEMFTRNQLGHIQIHSPGYLDRPSLYKNIPEFEVVGAKVAAHPEVEFWAPRLRAAGLASVGDKSTGVSIQGISPEQEARATRFDKKVVVGRTLSSIPSKEAVIGLGLAKVLSATVGDRLVIVSQGADGSIANDAYTIVGLSESGSAIRDQTTLYLHIEDAQELFVLEGRVHEIAIVIRDLKDVRVVAADLSASLSGSNLVVDPWQEFARAFYKAMTIDRAGNWIMIGIIVVLVAVGVLNTVLMTVLERRREYGVLRAVGTSPGQVMRLVVYEVTIMAVLSIAIGSILAYGVNYYFATYGFSVGLEITLGGILFDTMYSVIAPQVFWIPALAVFLSAVLVSLYPASRAAQTAPARAMRTH